MGNPEPQQIKITAGKGKHKFIVIISMSNNDNVL
jgi:hypothetical protein